MIDSIGDFFFWIDEVEERSDDVRPRREIDDDEDDDDDDSMKNAKIDWDDDSVNDLSEIDRRDFSGEIHLKNCCLNDWFDAEIIDEFHLLNCWSIDWTFWSSIESDCCLFNDSSIEDADRCLIDCDDENRCLIDWCDDDRCLIDCENKDRCLTDCEAEDRFLIDYFSLFSDWEWWSDWVDRSRSGDCRADPDFCNPDRDCVCHE